MGGLRARLSAWLAERALRRSCARVGQQPLILGRVVVHGPGRVFIGDRVTLDASTAAIELHTLSKDSEIHLGDDVVLRSGASLEAEARITVGDRCALGVFSKVLDSHFHPVRGDRRARTSPQPVVLENDVVLEEGAILLPGAYLHAFVRVCKESVVSRKVPQGLTVAGVPATRVKSPPAQTGSAA